MGIGLDAKIPLYYDAIDGFYGLNKTIRENTKQSLKMLMLTAPGERVMLPRYGVGMRHFLFENTPQEVIINKINEQVQIFLPEIQIVKLEVVKGGKNLTAYTGKKNVLSVKMVYLVKALSLEDTLQLVETIKGVGI